MIHRPILTTLAASTLLALGACNSETGEVDSAAESEVRIETLAALIADDDDLSTVSDMLGDSGLYGVFDANAPYTFLAPTDAAFAAFDAELEGEEASAARVAIIREHIVPGYLTRDDIVAAIGRSDGSVEMQTMGSSTLSFSGDGDELVITSSDGAQARVAGTVSSGANGSVIPIDSVLKTLDAPS